MMQLLAPLFNQALLHKRYIIILARIESYPANWLTEVRCFTVPWAWLGSPRWDCLHAAAAGSRLKFRPKAEAVEPTHGGHLREFLVFTTAIRQVWSVRQASMPSAP